VEKEENVEWTSSADKEAIISHMSKAIKDNSLTLSRKDKQVQADNCLTQIALVSWLTSPSGYKRKQASSVEIYPSESTMYQEYARLWCHAGRCPKTYGMYRDQMTELGITQKQVGKVDMDKLKLKSGFFSNFKNGTTTAMAASTGKSKHSLAKEISRLIKREGGFNDSSSNDEGEKSFTDAKYVNIFRLKTWSISATRV
jgi:phosphotransferase system IIB component